MFLDFFPQKPQSRMIGLFPAMTYELSLLSTCNWLVLDDHYHEAVNCESDTEIEPGLISYRSRIELGRLCY